MYSFGNAILMLNFFKKLPDSLIESAKIDGAQEFTILFKVILPLSKPLLATIALFVGVGHWNDWFAPAYFVTNKKLMTMPATLMRLLSENTALQKMKEVNSAVSGCDRDAGNRALRHADRFHRPHHHSLSLPAEILHPGHDGRCA